MKIPPSCQKDVTLGALTHTFWAPPPSIPPAPDRFVPSLEFPAPHHWTGWASGTAAFTEGNTRISGEQYTLDGHDQGQMLLDITYPPLNVWYAFMWPFSTRQMMFSSSAFRHGPEKKKAALHWFALPMITCADPIKLPTALPVGSYFRHSTWISFTWDDVAAGFAKIAQIVAVDVLFAAIGGDLKAKNFSKGFSKGARGLKGDKIVRHAAERASKKGGKLADDASDQVRHQIARRNPLRRGAHKVNKAVGNRVAKVGDGLDHVGDLAGNKINDLVTKPLRKKYGKYLKKLRNRVDEAGDTVKTLDDELKAQWKKRVDLRMQKDQLANQKRQLDADANEKWLKASDEIDAGGTPDTPISGADDLRSRSRQLDDEIAATQRQLDDLSAKYDQKLKELDNAKDELSDETTRLRNYEQNVPKDKFGNVVAGRRSMKGGDAGDMPLSSSGRLKLDHAESETGLSTTVLRSMAVKFGLTPSMVAKDAINGAAGLGVDQLGNHVKGYSDEPETTFVSVLGGPLPSVSLEHTGYPGSKGETKMVPSAYEDGRQIGWIGS